MCYIAGGYRHEVGDSKEVLTRSAKTRFSFGENFVLKAVGYTHSNIEM